MTSAASILAKKIAKDAGELHYFTGKPCKRGHVEKRFVSSGACVKCSHGYILTSRKNDPERHRQTNARSEYKWRDARNERQRDKQVENRPLKAYHQALRRARLRHSAPAWLTPEQKAEIKTLYVEAWRLTRDTGVLHSVDHDVPLKGKDVCGLHVPWNLKVMTWQDNVVKGNRRS